MFYVFLIPKEFVNVLTLFDGVIDPGYWPVIDPVLEIDRTILLYQGSGPPSMIVGGRDMVAYGGFTFP